MGSGVNALGYLPQWDGIAVLRILIESDVQGLIGAGQPTTATVIGASAWRPGSALNSTIIFTDESGSRWG
jgi:hypothetical protein